MVEVPSIAALLPHGRDMILLHQLCSWGDTFVECAARAEDAGVLSGGAEQIPAWVGLEYMAQTAAVLAGLKAWKDGVRPQRGVIIGAPSIVCRASRFRRGEPLTIRAELDVDGGAVKQFICEIHRAGRELVQTGTIIVYLLNSN